MAYNFDEDIDRHNTGSIKWDACVKGEIPMFIADADFAAPPAVLERIRKRAEHPVFGYTRPDKKLKSIIAQRVNKDFGSVIKEEWIEFTGGVVPALSVAADAVGGTCMVNTPNYGMMLTAPVKAGHPLIKVPLKNENENYSIDFDAMERAVTPDTRLFYLCNPHNPVGHVYSRKELEEISAFAKAHNLIVVSDEIHCELVYDGTHIPFYDVDEYARNHSIVLTATGKTYNLPGCTFSYAVIADKDLREKFVNAGYAMAHPGIFNLEAGIAAYGESEDWRNELVAYLKSNRDYLYEELKKRFPKAAFTYTKATYLQWIDFRAYGENIDADYIKRKAGVILSGGDFFDAPGYVRLNFACTKKTLQEALERIERAVKLNII